MRNRNKGSKRSLGRRVVALVAAYAIVLSGLLASFGAARAATQVTGNHGAILCHTETADSQSPSTDGTTGRICVDNCCVGCLTPLVAVPPPSVNFAEAPATSNQKILAPLEIAGFSGIATKSHRSRAPPQTT